MTLSRKADPVANAKALAPLLQSRLGRSSERGGFRRHSWRRYSMLGSSDCSFRAPMAALEVEPVVFMQVLEEVARHDASTAWCLGQNGVCAMASAFLAPGPAHAPSLARDGAFSPGE